MGKYSSDILNLVSLQFSETESQRELLHARHSQGSAVQAKGAVIRTVVERCIGICVEADRVGHVEYFPRKPDIHILTDVPTLGQARLNSEVALSADVVAASRFPRISKGHRCERRGNIWSYLDARHNRARIKNCLPTLL